MESANLNVGGRRFESSPRDHLEKGTKMKIENRLESQKVVSLRELQLLDVFIYKNNSSYGPYMKIVQQHGLEFVCLRTGKTYTDAAIGVGPFVVVDATLTIKPIV